MYTKKHAFIHYTCVLLSLLMFTKVVAQNLNSGLVAKYSFTGNANDESGNGYNGIINQATPISDRNGTANSAYYFNGSTSVIELPITKITQKFSVSLWLKPDSGVLTKDYPGFITFLNASNYEVFNPIIMGPAYGTDKGKMAVCSRPGTGTGSQTCLVTNSLVPIGSWIHVAITFNNEGNLETYFNGIQVGSMDVNLNAIDTNLTKVLVGKATCSNHCEFKGAVDDIRIYSRVLQPCEIANLYSNDSSATQKPTLQPVPSTTLCVNESRTYSVEPIANAQTYEWRVNGVSVQNSPLTSLEYTPQSTDANNIIKFAVRAYKNCVASDWTEFSVFISPAPVQPTGLSQSNTAACLNGNTLFSVQPIANISYQWSENGTPIQPTTQFFNTFSKSWSSTGTYTMSVKAINGSGCKSTAVAFGPVVVNEIPLPPVPVSTPASAACSGENASFEVSGSPTATYSWFANGVNTGVTSNVYSLIWPLNAGNQTISVAQMVNGCISAPYVFPAVVVTNTPSNPVISGNSVDVCLNQSPLYAATGSNSATSYEWNLNGNLLASNSQTISPLLLNGANTLSVIAKNGACQSAIDTLAISAIDKPATSVINGPDQVCPKYQYDYEVADPVTTHTYFYRVNNAVNMSYYDGVAVPFTRIKASFDYVPGQVSIIEVTATNSCGATVSHKTVAQLANVPPIPQLSEISGNRLTVTNYDPTSTLVWAGAFRSTSQPQIVRWIPKFQPVSVSASKNGCTYTTQTGCSPANGARTEATEISETSEIGKVYPNPSNGSIQIETDGSVGFAYIMNLNGQVTQTVSLTEGNYLTKAEINTPGVYFVKLKTSTLSKTFKLIVE